MLAQGFKLFRTLLNSEASPTKVLDVNTDSYSSRNVLFREESLFLYDVDPTVKKDKQKYEIVFNKPYTESLHQAFSLFRSEQEDEAVSKFVCLKDKVPVFIDIAREMVNIHGLQKLCDTLAEHPEWTLAHLAANFELVDAFAHSVVNCHLNSSDSQTGMSPLQVAISTHSIQVVKVLINAKCSLEHLDHKGNSVYHYAASTNKDIILALTKGSSGRCMNARNHNGHTPLHLACLANKPECVNALLLGGADVNVAAAYHSATSSGDELPSYVGTFLQDHPKALSTQDMKNGGTPLHWSSSKAVINQLVEVNCNINALDFLNRTALHVMVLSNRLDCVVALLSKGADPDLGDNEGNRPIHLAVQMGNVSIIQSLIIFGANIDVLNNRGETPRHSMKMEHEPKLLYYLHTVGASRCPPETYGCTEGCSSTGSYNGDVPPSVLGQPNRSIINQMMSVAGMHAASRKVKVGKKCQLLCLDGGGIRGLVLIQTLLELERVIGKPINNCFDWIAGTSTGGILALGLASGKTLRECLCIYFQMKDATFIGIRPYPSDPLETVLKNTFGTHTVMADIVHPKLMISGVLADRKPVELHLFRNYQSASEILNVKEDGPFESPLPPEEQLLWHVGRATGAAPTYFRAFGRFVDGGLISNNPTLDALTEIAELNLALDAVGRREEIAELSLVVSLGTGLIPVTEIRVDSFRPESIWDSARLVMGLQALGTLLVDQATATDGRVVDRARAWCSSIGVPYYRFTPQMSEDVPMDEGSDEKLVKMLFETKAYMHANIQEMREIASLLTD